MSRTTRGASSAGFFHPTSQIAVRMPTRKAEIVDAAFLKARLATALELRRRLGLPSERTTAFRWVNAEGYVSPASTSTSTATS